MAWSFTSRAPVYMQIVSRIRADILGGVYQPDQQIPAVRQLAQTAGNELCVGIGNLTHEQQWLTWKLHLPEGWTAQPGGEFCVNLNQRHGGCAVTQLDFSVTPGEINQGRYDLLIEIHSNGRMQKLFMELPLLPA